MSVSSSDKVLLDGIRSFVPALGPHLYKGKCGRIGIIGGCKEYTGAPYFAAISAMKLGGDLSFVFCTGDAAPVIKSYSPELIVYPVLDSSSAVTDICQTLPKLHCLVIGPGLGRNEQLLDNVKGVLRRACELQLPLVIDADGVFLLSQEPTLINGYTKAILTPNAVEFDRLYHAVIGDKSSNKPNEVSELSRALGNVTIVKKGQEDVIANANHTLTCSTQGSHRRCGGQGDLTAGSMGVFSYWAHSAFEDQQTNNPALASYGPTLCAAYAACTLTRHCARRAFERTRRSTTTTDMIAAIGDVFSENFEQ